MGVFTDNNRTALSIVRALKNKQSGLRIEKKDYSPVFRKYEQRYFDVTPFLKIERLVGDIIFWKYVQLLYAFVDGKSNWFENDFRLTVIKVVTDEDEDEKNNVVRDVAETDLEAVLDATGAILKRYSEELKRYLLILRKLELVGRLIERESDLTWLKLDEFEKRSDIKDCVQALKDIFAEDLKPFELESEEQKESKDER